MTIKFPNERAQHQWAHQAKKIGLSPTAVIHYQTEVWYVIRPMSEDISKLYEVTKIPKAPSLILMPSPTYTHGLTEK